jgi:hypothetical protein
MGRRNDVCIVITAKDIEAARLKRKAAMGTDREGAALDEMRDLIDAANREWWEERAAIREYCGGQSRQDAERDALTDIGGES